MDFMSLFPPLIVFTHIITNALLALPLVSGFRDASRILFMYRVAHLLWERNLLTSNSKFLCWPGSQDKTAKCNIKFGVNIFPSQADGLPCTKLIVMLRMTQRGFTIGLLRRVRDSARIVETASVVDSEICTDGSGKQ